MDAIGTIEIDGQSRPDSQIMFYSSLGSGVVEWITLGVLVVVGVAAGAVFWKCM